MIHVVYRTMKPFIVVDDLGGGVSVAAIAARDCSAANMNSLISLGAGPVRVVVNPQRAEALRLERMNNRRSLPRDTATRSAGSFDDSARAPFVDLVSVEARSGVHSGISAADRAQTAQVLGAEVPNSRDLVSPGHIFPRLGASGGLLERADAYQGALEVCGDGELDPIQATPAACVELLTADGMVASPAEAEAIGERLGLPVHSLTNLVRLKLLSSPLVNRTAQSVLPLAEFGDFEGVLYTDKVSNREHLALVRGKLGDPATPVTVRIHRKGLLEDVFGVAAIEKRHGASSAPSGRVQGGLTRIARSEHGVFLYLDSGTAIGKFEPMRDYAIGAQILVDLGVRKAIVVTDSMNNLVGSTIFGVEVVGQSRLTDADVSESAEFASKES